MKWVKLLIIVLSLSLPIHSYACWDDDWDDDMSWLFDDPFYCELNDDDDSSYSNDDGITFYDDDETTDSSDDDDSWYENITWDDDNSDNGENSWNDSSNENRIYYIPVLGEICLHDKLLNNWPAQDKNNNCVSFVLEYAFNYLNNTVDERYSAMHHAYEMIFEELYGVDLATYGLRQPQMLSFFKNCGFSVRNIEYEDVSSCINNGIPVVGTLKRSTEWAHECFVIGYIKEQDKLIIVNPWQGK